MFNWILCYTTNSNHMNFNCIKSDLNPVWSASLFGSGKFKETESEYHATISKTLNRKLYNGLRGDLVEMLFDNIDTQLYLELTKNDPELKMYEAA